MRDYQTPYQWIRTNISEPTPTIIYVAAASLGNSVKNAISQKKYDLLVEENDHTGEYMDIAWYFPRICFVERKDLVQEVSSVFQENTSVKVCYK